MLRSWRTSRPLAYALSFLGYSLEDIRYSVYPIPLINRDYLNSIPVHRRFAGPNGIFTRPVLRRSLVGIDVPVD
jgi:hypothetical protein